MSKVIVTNDVATNIGNALGLDWRKYKFEEFRRGLEVEQEHLRTIGKYSRGDIAPMLVAGMTVVDHLDENPIYYTLLDKAGL